MNKPENINGKNVVGQYNHVFWFNINNQQPIPFTVNCFITHETNTKQLTHDQLNSFVNFSHGLLSRYFRKYSTMAMCDFFTDPFIVDADIFNEEYLFSEHFVNFTTEPHICIHINPDHVAFICVRAGNETN